MEVEYCKACKILNLLWDVTCEGVGGKVEETEVGGERDRDITRQVVLLEVKGLQRRERNDVRW